MSLYFLFSNSRVIFLDAGPLSIAAYELNGLPCLNKIEITFLLMTLNPDKDDMSPRRKESNPWPPRYPLGAQTTELRETLGELGDFFNLSHS